MFKWTVEIEVDETWVADGFDLTDDSAHDMMMHRLPYSYGHETAARVIARPSDDDVARVQGFKSTREYVQRRDGVRVKK